MKRNGLQVDIAATVGSGWFLPMDSDIEVQGMTDVVMKDVNLTTNAGKITLEKVAAWGVPRFATSSSVAA
eukprot:COSAG05_NODE_8272_length_719_cov_1.730645_2_plen_70_part_00